MPFTDPRMLLCYHSACLKCLEDIQRKNIMKPGDVIPCPVCRNEFTIPPLGMSGLPKNFFIANLLEIVQNFNEETTSQHCKMCKIIDAQKDACEVTMICLNCRETFCERCVNVHRSTKLTQGHTVVEVKGNHSEEEILMALPPPNCPNHPLQVLNYYCGDCKAVVCVSCFVEKHTSHCCKDVSTVDKDFRKILENISTKMLHYISQMETRRSDVEIKRTNFLKQTPEIENAIRLKNQQLKAMIDEHTKLLLNELSSIKQRHLKNLETEVEEIERKMTILKSCEAYCSEINSKGSPTDVCSCVDGLIRRSDELKKENDKYLSLPDSAVEIKFRATDQNVLIRLSSNVIGKIEAPATAVSYAASAPSFAFGSSSFVFDPDFKWEGTGSTLFVSAKTKATREKNEDEDGESEGEGHAQEDENSCGNMFTPVVQLPKVEVKTGEEEEKEVFRERGKLYRFDNGNGQWKERGTGDMKILKHQVNGTFRLLLRREQVHKVACNHLLTVEIKLQAMSTSKNAWCWFAQDFSDGEAKMEKFALKFRTEDVSGKFREKFEECQRELSQPDKSTTAVHVISQSELPWSDSTKRLKNYAIVLGGSGDGISLFEDVTKINLYRSNDALSLQKMATQMQNEPASTIYGNTIYITGLGNKHAEIWKFDVTSDIWNKCASMIKGRRRHSVAFVDQFLYICGGYVDSDNSTLDDVEAYDAINDRCSSVGKLVHLVQNSDNCVPFESSFYIFGGRDANIEAMSHVQVYDTKSNTCTLLSHSMPVASSHLRAALFEKTVILLGKDSCFLFDIDKRAWQVRRQFGTGAVHFGMIIENDQIFVFGGGVWTLDAERKVKWTCRDDVRCIPLKNIIEDKAIEWRHHAKLSRSSLVFSCEKICFEAQTLRKYCKLIA